VGAGRRRGHQWGCVADTTDGRPGPSVLPGSDQDRQGKSRRPVRSCPFFASVASRQSRSARAASCLKYASCVLALPGFLSAMSHCSPSSTEAPRPISAPSPLAPLPGSLPSPGLSRFLAVRSRAAKAPSQEPPCLFLPCRQIYVAWSLCRVPRLLLRRLVSVLLRTKEEAKGGGKKQKLAYQSQIEQLLPSYAQERRDRIRHEHEELTCHVPE
jgi:hypothetical protein